MFPVTVLAKEHEDTCKVHIHKKNAWDYSSSYDSAQKWKPTELEHLCKGSNKPEEPVECFQKVITSHVKWGAKDKWEWKSAVTLFVGTDDTEGRITSFKDRISAGVKWDAAILECPSSSKIVIQ